jgi:hypothetical protein
VGADITHSELGRLSTESQSGPAIPITPVDPALAWTEPAVSIEFEVIQDSPQWMPIQKRPSSTKFIKRALFLSSGSESINFCKTPWA